MSVTHTSGAGDLDGQLPAVVFLQVHVTPRATLNKVHSSLLGSYAPSSLNLWWCLCPLQHSQCAPSSWDYTLCPVSGAGQRRSFVWSGPCPLCLCGHAESLKLFDGRESAGFGIIVYSRYWPRNKQSDFHARCPPLLLLSHKIEGQISHSSENKKMSATDTISDVSRMDAMAGLLAFHTSVNLCVNEVPRPSSQTRYFIANKLMNVHTEKLNESIYTL